MTKKYGLRMAVAFSIILITYWLTWAWRILASIRELLLAIAIAIIIWTLLEKKMKPASFLEFFVLSLVISYVANVILWFLVLTITAPWVYPYFNVGIITAWLIHNLRISLLPVAISVIIYGIYGMKLKAWEMFLSSWYVTTILLFIVRDVWWSFQGFHYISGTGAIMSDLFFVFLAFPMAGVSTLVYDTLRKTKRGTSTINLA